MMASKVPNEVDVDYDNDNDNDNPISTATATSLQSQQPHPSSSSSSPPPLAPIAMDPIALDSSQSTPVIAAPETTTTTYATTCMHDDASIAAASSTVAASAVASFPSVTSTGLSQAELLASSPHQPPQPQLLHNHLVQSNINPIATSTSTSLTNQPYQPTLVANNNFATTPTPTCLNPNLELPTIDSELLCNYNFHPPPVQRPRTLTIGSSTIYDASSSGSSSSSSSSCSLSLSSNQSTSTEMKLAIGGSTTPTGETSLGTRSESLSTSSSSSSSSSSTNHIDFGSTTHSTSTLATGTELTAMSGAASAATAAAANAITMSMNNVDGSVASDTRVGVDKTKQDKLKETSIFSELSQLCLVKKPNNFGDVANSSSTSSSSSVSIADSNQLVWKQIARWVKYEENVEQNGTRWSKPYVSAVNLSAFLELKNSLQHGVVLLDTYATTFEQLVDEFLQLILIKNIPMLAVGGNNQHQQPTESQSQSQLESITRIGQLLLLPKQHQFQMKSSLIRSLTDLRSIPSSSSSLSTYVTNNYPLTKQSNITVPANTTAVSSNSLSSLNKIKDKLEPDNANFNNNNNNNDDLDSNHGNGRSHMTTTTPTINKPNSNSSEDETSIKGAKGSKLQYNRAFRKKLPANTVSNSILIGEVDFLAYPVSGLIRLQTATKLDNLNEVSIPTKFVYIYLGPSVKCSPAASTDYWQIGRAYATLMSDPNFASIALRTQNPDLLSLAIDEFISQAPILPPNIWDTETRIEPPEKLPTINYSQKHFEQQQQYQQHLLLMAAQDNQHHQVPPQSQNPIQNPVPQSYYNKAFDEYDEYDGKPIMMGQPLQGTPVSVPTLHQHNTNNNSSQSTISTVSAQDHQHSQHHHLSPHSHQLAPPPPPPPPPHHHHHNYHYDSSATFHEDNNNPYYFSKVNLPELSSEDEEEIERKNNGLTRSGRLFGGLINDIRRKLPHYKSDITDALALQSIASIVFLYFACLAPIITFGGMLGDATGNNIATMESLVCGALCGIVYALFSGQPLTILGSTGPVLVFETIVYDFCQSNGYVYLSFRFWIGMWTTLILFLLVAFDASFFVCYITRFTEENFASLISVIFIYNALEKLVKIGNQYPVNWNSANQPDYNCSCFYENQSRSVPLQIDRPNPAAIAQCLSGGNIVVGRGCQTPEYIPNVYLFSVLLFLFTAIISVKLAQFRNSRFFDTKVRQFIGDFAVPIAITAMTLFDYMVGVATPKLHVPTDFKPTLSSRTWLVSPLVPENPVWLSIVAVFPAMLATILIFMDQQITAVIVNRKEHKLKKGCGYHLDLFVLSILIGICSVFGLPWFVAATVLSITHVNSLKMLSESAAPGEKPQFFGVREQRITNVSIFILCGLSIFFTTILQKIPMPVLYGVFLYMGVSSLDGSQFIDRILIIFMPQKYQPDYTFLRRVSSDRIHLFTLIQIVCFVFLWIVKSYKAISIAFPLMLLVILSVRKLLDFVFTQDELKVLDDTMPESKRHKKKRKQLEQQERDLAEKSKKFPPNNLNAMDDMNEINPFSELKLRNEFKLNVMNGDERF